MLLFFKMPRSRTKRVSSRKKPTKAPNSSTPEGKSIAESLSPATSPKRPKLGHSKSPSPDNGAAPAQPARIVGSKLSGVKHSGLLAKDQEKSELLPDAPLLANLTLTSPSSPAPDPLSKKAMSGKKMYSFSSKTQMGKKGLTPKLRFQEDESGHLDEQSKATSSGGSSSIARKEGKKNDSDASLSEEEMEVDKKKSKATPGRVTRRSKKIVSDSESDMSEVSEDEELALLTAKLNRGEAISGASEDVLEDYFTAQSGKASKTSDHTLSKLACPKMDQHSIQDALKATSSSYEQECQSLYREYTNLYSYWLHLLTNGYNVLLYGLGSKKQLLEDFCKKHLQDSCHVVVNGFFPGLTTKQILTTLSSDLLGHSGSFKSLLEQANFICSELEDRHISTPNRGPPKKLFLIIHNIDGAMLRGGSSQTALSMLAQSPAVHVLASVDHINAPLIWDQRKLSKFNWLWHDVTTFEFYRDETSYENSLLVQQSGSLALSSLTHVTRSLTPNARGIFELLVKYQLEHKRDNVYLGMSFHDCYVKCREKFLVNSDMTLRAQLTEFWDHKLVRSRKGLDGVEYLFIPIDNGTLTQFLEQKSD